MVFMGVKRFDELPNESELPPARSRCCHVCMKMRGDDWIVLAHEDLTIWLYPVCDDCFFASCDEGQYGESRSEFPVDPKVWERVQQYNANFREWMAANL